MYYIGISSDLSDEEINAMFSSFGKVKEGKIGFFEINDPILIL